MSSRIYSGPAYRSRRYKEYDVTLDEIRAEQYHKKAEALVALFWVAFCVVGGGGLAWLLTPWIRSLGPIVDNQFGSAPQVYRDVSSATGIASYGLLWLSMMFGLLISGRMSRVWPGGPEAFELHRFCSLLALAFTLFHVFVLMGDPYLGGSPVPLLAFGMLAAKAPWSWVGQLSLYLLALVAGSFYLRRWIGKKTWRALHAGAFALYLIALAHSVGATRDSSIPILGAFYWATAGGLVMLAVLRSLVVLKANRKRNAKRSFMKT